jgi:hypothetical protein
LPAAEVLAAEYAVVDAVQVERCIWFWQQQQQRQATA